jgi:hypothetical protein
LRLRFEDSRGAAATGKPEKLLMPSQMRRISGALPAL